VRDKPFQNMDPSFFISSHLNFIFLQKKCNFYLFACQTQATVLFFVVFSGGQIRSIQRRKTPGE